MSVVAHHLLGVALELTIPTGYWALDFGESLDTFSHLFSPILICTNFPAEMHPEAQVIIDWINFYKSWTLSCCRSLASICHQYNQPSESFFVPVFFADANQSSAW